MTSHRATSRERMHSQCENLSAVRAWTVIPDGYSLDRLPAVVETCERHGEDSTRQPKSHSLRTMHTLYQTGGSKGDTGAGKRQDHVLCGFVFAYASECQ